MASETAAPVRPRLWTRSYVIIILVSLFTFLGFQMLLPTLPVYAKRLGASDAEAGMVIGIFALAALLVRPLTGYALDRWGRKVILLSGLAIFILSVVAYHWALTLALLLTIRFIHGIGWGICSTSSSTVATDVIPKSRMGEGMGYYGLAGTVSMAIGPAIGLWVVSWLDFSALFSATAAMVVVAVGFAAVILRYPVVPLTSSKTFILWEKSALPSATVMFFLTMTYGSIVSFLALYAAQNGITNIGPFFTGYALALLVTRPLAGKLSDRIGHTIIIVPGILCVVAAMILLAYANTLPWFIAAAVMYGLGLGLAMPSLQALAVIFTPPDRRGAANGTFFTGFDLGLSVGSVLWGAVAEVTGYSLMYLWTTLPAFISLIVYLNVRHKKRRSV